MSNRRKAALVAAALSLIGAVVAALMIDVSSVIVSLSTWAERAQRLPTPVLATPNRVSLTQGGGAVQRTHHTARILDERAITGGPVTCLAELDNDPLYGTFDGGAYRASTLPAPEKLAIDDRVNALAANRHRLWFATNGGAFALDETGARRLAPGAFTGVAVWTEKRGSPRRMAFPWPRRAACGRAVRSRA